MKNHSTNKAKILLTIAGPTAVGKTALVLDLAKTYHSEVFSADSRQLYKELTIGTAKPSTSELNEITHHFIDHRSVREPYNAGMYERETDEALRVYFERNEIGILSGGTGMYINAVLYGLDAFPGVDPKIREHYETLFKQQGIEPLQHELKSKDPIYAQQVDLQNPRRLIRALSVIGSSNKPFSDFLNQRKEKQLPYSPLKICLTRERSLLYERINHRVDQMMEAGLLEEVKNLTPWQELKALQTVGYSELFKHLRGELSLEEAVALIKRNSRRYAKRQMTWFRNQGDWTFFDAAHKDKIEAFIKTRINELKKS